MSIADQLGNKWARQFGMDEDPRLFDLRADLLLLVTEYQKLEMQQKPKEIPWPPETE